MARILSGCGRRGTIPLPAGRGTHDIEAEAAALEDPDWLAADISSFFGSLR